MRIRGFFVLVAALALVSTAEGARSQCAATLGRTLEVSALAKNALETAKRTGILEARVVLHIPSAGARGTLPPYVQLIVEREKLKAALEAVGANVQRLAEADRTVARLSLRVVGPFAPVMKAIAANPWVVRLVTDADHEAPPAPETTDPDHGGRRKTALEVARAEALRPSSVELETRLAETVQAGFMPLPDEAEVALVATQGPVSVYLASLPAEHPAKGERTSVLYLVRVLEREGTFDGALQGIVASQK